MGLAARFDGQGGQVTLEKTTTELAGGRLAAGGDDDGRGAQDCAPGTPAEHGEWSGGAADARSMAARQELAEEDELWQRHVPAI